MNRRDAAICLSWLTLFFCNASCQSDSLHQAQPLSASYCSAHHCKPLPGNLQGRLCDHSQGQWLQGVLVSLQVQGRIRNQTTDDNGFFQFNKLPPGYYPLHLQGHPNLTTLNATVYPDTTSQIGVHECNIQFGALQGRICGPNERWLDQARVSVQTAASYVETNTNPLGYYTLSQIPVGNHQATVERGSFRTSFSIYIETGATKIIQEPVCIPPTTRMAVVTGIYDQVQTIIQELGYRVREHFTDRPVGITYELDSEGSIDLINGSNSSYWLEDFLADPVWMSDYDIILFNCGLADGLLNRDNQIATNAIYNLRDFVKSGGSIYVSDWASELIRMAFPGRINFLGDDSQFGLSRIGMDNTHQTAQIEDHGLKQAIGVDSVQVNMNLPLWSVLDSEENQPGDLTILVKGNVFHYDPTDYSTIDDDLKIVNSPLIVRFYHEAGQVLYTSTHTESQTTNDLRNILDHLIFEL